RALREARSTEHLNESGEIRADDTVARHVKRGMMRVSWLLCGGRVATPEATMQRTHLSNLVLGLVVNAVVGCGSDSPTHSPTSGTSGAGGTPASDGSAGQPSPTGGNGNAEGTSGGRAGNGTAGKATAGTSSSSGGSVGNGGSGNGGASGGSGGSSG